MREEQAWMRTGQDTRQTRPQRTGKTEMAKRTAERKRNGTGQAMSKAKRRLYFRLAPRPVSCFSSFVSTSHMPPACLFRLVIIILSRIYRPAPSSRYSVSLLFPPCHSSRLARLIRTIRHGTARHGTAYDERRASKNGASSNTITHGASEQAGYRAARISERRTERRAKRKSEPTRRHARTAYRMAHKRLTRDDKARR